MNQKKGELMVEKGIPYSRGRQILCTLHEHGALSTRGLRKILYPAISKSGVKQSLKILKNKGLVVPRFDSLPQNCGNYYQLSLTENTRPVISKMTGIHEAHLQGPVIRDQELYHSEECAIWTNRFRLMFPEAELTREFQHSKDDRFKNILLSRHEDGWLMPDILMQFPESDTRTATTIAIEIERSRKSGSRLYEKLKKLATQTRLDGVIYICATSSILETIRQLYQKKVRENALRVSHYGDNFFLFSNGVPSANEPAPLMLNSELKPVSLFKWVQFLVSTEQRQRFRENQKLMANA